MIVHARLLCAIILRKFIGYLIWIALTNINQNKWQLDYFAWMLGGDLKFIPWLSCSDLFCDKLASVCFAYMYVYSLLQTYCRKCARVWWKFTVFSYHPRTDRISLCRERLALGFSGIPVHLHIKQIFRFLWYSGYLR